MRVGWNKLSYSECSRLADQSGKENLKKNKVTLLQYCYVLTHLRIKTYVVLVINKGGIRTSKRKWNLAVRKAFQYLSISLIFPLELFIFFHLALLFSFFNKQNWHGVLEQSYCSSAAINLLHSLWMSPLNMKYKKIWKGRKSWGTLQVRRVPFIYQKLHQLLIIRR